MCVRERNVVAMTDNLAGVPANDQVADHGARERFIRDIYAALAFFINNPELPVPAEIQLKLHCGDPAGVQAVAAARNVRAYPRDGVEGGQCHFDVPGTVSTVTVMAVAR